MSTDQRLIVSMLRSPSLFLALGFGSGLAPKAPGTFGTVVAVAVMPLLLLLPPLLFWITLLCASLGGILICERAGKRLGRHDPGAVVWDEMVAMWWVLAFTPLHWPWWLAAFGLFRLFDIFKPWPIRWLDRRVGGGFGVMLDDWAAAAYTLLVIQVLN